MEVNVVIVFSLIFVGTVICSPPRCRLPPISRQAGYGVPDQIECVCRSEHPHYIGNLNFLKEHLVPLKLYNRTVDISVQKCSTIELDVNMAEITDKLINLRIEESDTVKITNISPVSIPVHQQSIIVQNVTHFYLTGRVDCVRCSQTQGPLHFQFRNVSHVILENLNSSSPVKISGRHLVSVSLYQTFLATLPWPGIFLFNATRVSITHCSFPSLDPKSITLTLGEEVNVTHNLMDVANALKLLQYQHINIQCNRRSADEPLSVDCWQSLLIETVEDSGLGKFDEQAVIINNDSSSGGIEDDNCLLAALVSADWFGLLILTLSILLVLLFLLIFCCFRCCLSSDSVTEKSSSNGGSKGVSDLALATSFLGSRLIPESSGSACNPEDVDEYSNSSRAHLAQGVDDPLRLHYVTVQGVKAESGEGGIVCGSLTLGPAYNVKDNDSLRATSSNRLKAQTFSKVQFK